MDLRYSSLSAAPSSAQVRWYLSSVVAWAAAAALELVAVPTGVVVGGVLVVKLRRVGGELGQADQRTGSSGVSSCEFALWVRMRPKTMPKRMMRNGQC